MFVISGSLMAERCGDLELSHSWNIALLI